MLRILFKATAISIGIGSFIYLLNGVFGAAIGQQAGEILSVWIASAFIGAASALYYTKISDAIVTVIQFTVGITAFTAAALFNGWIAVNVTDMFFYAGAIFIIMLIIFVIFYLLSVQDSKKINEKLNER